MSEKKSSSDEQILESLVRRADFEDEHEALSPDNSRGVKKESVHIV